MYQTALEENHKDKVEPNGWTIKRRGLARTYIEYSVAWLILKSLGILPRSLALLTGRTIGGLAHLVLPHLRRNAETNLKIAFPDLAERQRELIKRGVFSNLGRLLGEISQFPHMNNDNISSIVT